MGYNTVVFILNDAGNDITANPQEFVDGIAPILGGGLPTRFDEDNNLIRKPVDIRVGSHANGASGVWCEHADMVGVIIVGGNYATVCGHYHNGNQGHHSEEDQIRILGEILRKKGYKIVKDSKYLAEFKKAIS